VKEESYRQSRLCRLLGNPVAFAIVELLAENEELGSQKGVKKGSGPLLAFSHKPGSPRRRKFLSPLGLLVHRGLISNLLS